MRAILSSLSHESGEVATHIVTALAALARGDDDDFDAAVRALVAEFAAGQTVSSETRMDAKSPSWTESLSVEGATNAPRRLCAELGGTNALVRLADVIVDWRGDDPRAARDGDGDGLELETDADSETASEARLAFSLVRGGGGDEPHFAHRAGMRRRASRDCRARARSSHLFRALFPCWCHAPSRRWRCVLPARTISPARPLRAGRKGRLPKTRAQRLRRGSARRGATSI